jgi:hypothetical protein
VPPFPQQILDIERQSSVGFLMKRSKRSLVCIAFKCKTASFVFEIIGAHRTHALVQSLQHRQDSLICAPISKCAASLLWYIIGSFTHLSAIPHAYSSGGRYPAVANPLPNGHLLAFSLSLLLVILPKTTRLNTYVSNIKDMLPPECRLQSLRTRAPCTAL